MNVTSPKPFVFVLMPFASEFEDVYKLGIKPACVDAGAYCERVDEQIFQESILERIYNQISKADFVVADMTGRNPNVFYETGYSHALGKRVVLLTRNADDIPFDLKHYPHIVYGNSIATLKDELQRRLRWFIENPDRSESIIDSELEFFISGKPLGGGEVLPAWHTGSTDKHRVDFQIHNPNNRIIQGNRLKLAIVAKENLWAYDERTTPFPLPDNRYLYELPDVGEIFPDGWVYLPFVIEGQYRTLTKGQRFEMVLRVFTEIGVKEFPFELELQFSK